jgi:hypothetical protein
MDLLSIENHCFQPILKVYWAHRIVFIISVWNLILVLYRLPDCIQSETDSKRGSESPGYNKSAYPSLTYRKCWYHLESFQPNVSWKSSWPDYASAAIFFLRQWYCGVWANFWRQPLDCPCIFLMPDAPGDTSFSHQISTASQNLVHNSWHIFDRNVSFQETI